MKPITALSLFNGISGLHLALDRAEIPINKVYYSEIDKFANQVTEYHYPNDVALGDVTKWEGWDIDWSEIDLVTAGFPCFAKGESVLTNQGYKNIEDIQLGDMVMSHTNQWRNVTNLFHKQNTVWTVKAQGVLKTNTTEEHPYYVSKMIRVNGKRTFSKPEWVEVKNLTTNHFVCFPKIKGNRNDLNLSLEDCYIIGRYIADGHTAKHNRTEKGREHSRFYNLILSVGSHKIPKIETKHTLHQHTKSTHRMVFCNKRLVDIVEKYCGCGALNKYIHPMFLELPTELLSELVRGIMDGDGCEKEGVFRITSVSKELVMSLNLAVMRLYGVVGSVVKTIRPKTTVICGRTVNQEDTYTLQFTKEVRKQKKYHETDDYFLSPIKSVINTGVIDDVYNIEVDTDNSYTVNNAIVHNCQAWSVAGKQLGDKDERGMLFWTTLDIIKKVLDSNPNAKFLMENVKMKKDFEEYITYHTEQTLGYVEKTLINSALVSAQNRNRYYWTNFKVSELPRDEGIVLKDIVEEPIDQDYNLSNEAVSRFKLYEKKQGNCIGTTKRDGKIGQRDLCYGALGKMGCLTATMYKQAPQYVILNGKGIKDLDREVCADDIINESATKDGKSYALTAHYSGAVAWNSIERKQRTMMPVSNSSDVKPNVYNGVLYRKLTPVECERLQNVPDNFTSMLSKTQRYKCLGNGWTIDVIAHILKYAFEK